MNLTPNTTYPYTFEKPVLEEATFPWFLYEKKFWIIGLFVFSNISLVLSVDKSSTKIISLKRTVAFSTFFIFFVILSFSIKQGIITLTCKYIFSNNFYISFLYIIGLRFDQINNVF